MSLLKFPSLLSNPSWTMMSSTLNACSTVGSLSFRAFFPRTTEKRRFLVWELKQKSQVRSTCRSSAPAAVTAGDLTSYPSGKQWAAVRTQQDEIRLPPQRKTFSLVALRQNMAATHGWDSTVATDPPTIFMSFLLLRRPHVSAAGGWNQDQYTSGETHDSRMWWVQKGGWSYLVLDQLVQVQVKEELELED